VTALAATPFVAPEIDWFAVSPPLVVLLAAVAGILVEAFVPRRARHLVQVTLATAALVVALVLVVALWGDPPEQPAVVAGALIVDRVGLFLWGTLLALSLAGMLGMADRTRGEDAFAPMASATPGSAAEKAALQAGLQQTEVFPLMLFAVGGMLVFSTAGDLLTMFVALEVLSLPLYLLCGLARRRRLLSQEASMKYFLLGAFASALFLYGIALLYGAAGSVSLLAIGQLPPQALDLRIVVLGIVLVLVGLLFKVGAVPFHSWTPDVYSGAPTPVTGFMAAATKVAAFGAMLRVLYLGMPALGEAWLPVLLAIATVTMVFGSLVAIAQNDVKRMLAYSSVAHAGFILTGLVALDAPQQAATSVLFYLAAYGFTTIGAFAAVSVVRERDATGGLTGEATHLSQWAGLGRRSPALAAAFTLFLLAFAGIPLTSGFTAKFSVFSAAVAGGHAWLAVVGVLASAVAVAFYLRVVVVMYFAPADGEGTAVAAAPLTAAAVAVGAAVTILLGVVPAPVLGLLDVAAGLPVP
jgi:NADH-quinone oxidoreductase subunit N